MKKDKKFSFFNMNEEGKEICNVTVTPESSHNFEVMVRRLLRYGDRFGYNLQYSTEECEE